MSWFKLDDGFHDHPKVVQLRLRRAAPHALMTWVLTASWASRHGSCGMVPDAQLKAMRLKDAWARELVACGLWDKTEGGYRFHDWDDYSPESQGKSKNKERQARYRERQRNSLRNVTGDGNSNALRNVTVTSPPRARDPVPSRPVPSKAPPVVPPPGTHTPLSSELDERIAIAIGEFGRRYESARGMPWMGHSRAHRALSGLVAWADAMGGRSGRGWRQEACQALDGYFRDSWAQEKDFPVSALSGAPGKYHTPPKEPADSVRRIERGQTRDVMREAMEFSKEGTVPQTLRVPGKVRGA